MELYGRLQEDVGFSGFELKSLVGLGVEGLRFRSWKAEDL